MKYNTKEQIFLTQFFIYMQEEGETTYEDFKELMDITKPQFSLFVKSFKQMLSDLKMNYELIIEPIKDIEHTNRFATNKYHLIHIGNNNFNYEDLDEERLVKYSMFIVFLMLRNKQYVTKQYLDSIFPNFNKKIMFNLISKLKEIVPGEIDKNELFSYIIELD